MREEWSAQWDADGLGTWVVREKGQSDVIGYGGCSILPGALWNLGYRLSANKHGHGYRLSANKHGHGYATELAKEGVRQAQLRRPNLPVVAFLLAHNVASEKVAQRLGFKLVGSFPDAGNPHPKAIRLVYADRQLNETQLATTLTH